MFTGRHLQRDWPIQDRAKVFLGWGSEAKYLKISQAAKQSNSPFAINWVALFRMDRIWWIWNNGRPKRMELQWSRNVWRKEWSMIVTAINNRFWHTGIYQIWNSKVKACLTQRVCTLEFSFRIKQQMKYWCYHANLSVVIKPYNSRRKRYPGIENYFYKGSSMTSTYTMKNWRSFYVIRKLLLTKCNQIWRIEKRNICPQAVVYHIPFEQQRTNSKVSKNIPF